MVVSSLSSVFLTVSLAFSRFSFCYAEWNAMLTDKLFLVGELIAQLSQVKLHLLQKLMVAVGLDIHFILLIEQLLL